MFINGKIAPVFVRTCEIAGEKSCPKEEISWCGNFVDAANRAKTSNENMASGGGTSEKQPVAGGHGPVAHARFKAFPYLDDHRIQPSLNALGKGHLLLAERTDRDPMLRGQAPGPGRVIRSRTRAEQFLVCNETGH